MTLKEWFHRPGARYGTHAIFFWLWGAWRGNRLQALLNVLIGVSQVGVSLLLVAAVQQAIDVASGSRPGDIYRAVGWMGILMLCNFGLNISAVWVRNILGVRAQNRMQQRMLDHILRSEWHGRESMHSGDVLNRLETDVSQVITFLTETLPNMLSVLCLFVGAFCYLLSMDVVLALITVGILPVFLLLSKVYIRRMRRLTREVRAQDSRVQSVLQETVQHRMLIKTLEGVGRRHRAVYAAVWCAVHVFLSLAILCSILVSPLVIS